MVRKNTAVWMGLLVLLAGLGTGCGPTKPEMAPRDVRVTLDDSLRDNGKLKSVQVDIKAVNPTEEDRWRNIPVDAYWASGSSLASSPDIYVMKFNYQENVNTKLLSKTDPIWKKWEQQGAMDLVVIASIPGLSGNGVGAQDPRRLILPLDTHRWDELSEIRINVSQSGITTPNTPKPIKQ